MKTILIILSIKPFEGILTLIVIIVIIGMIYAIREYNKTIK